MQYGGSPGEPRLIKSKKSDNKTDFFDSKIYQWKENNTLMQVDLLTGESFEPIVRFGVSRFSE